MRLVVLSSSKDILQAIQAAIAAKHLNAEIVLAVVVQPTPPTQPLPILNVELFSMGQFLDAETEKNIVQKIYACQPDLVVLENNADQFTALLAQLSQQLMVLQPALPGEFPGEDAIGDAYDAFQRGDILNSGITVYATTPGSTTRQVLLKAGVPMLIEDTLEEFAARMHTMEQQLIIKAIALYAAKHDSANGN